MLSRRKSRRFLMQSLYAHIYQVPISADALSAMCLQDADIDPKTIDFTYINTLFGLLREHEVILLAIIERLAPKFPIDTMPKVHLLILMIALTEILYWNGGDIDMSVSVNEAVELAKEFSDQQGKNFINGVLASFARDPDAYTHAGVPKTRIHTIFAPPHHTDTTKNTR